MTVAVAVLGAPTAITGWPAGATGVESTGVGTTGVGTRGASASPDAAGGPPVGDSAGPRPRREPVQAQRAVRGTRPEAAGVAPPKAGRGGSAAGSSPAPAPSPAPVAPVEEAPPGTSAGGPAPQPQVQPQRGGGLSGATFYGPNAGAAQAAGRPGIPPADAALLAELARVPTATWLGPWSGDVAATVRRAVADARAAGGVPVLVAYDIPDRDCGGHSSGGADSQAAYARWIRALAEGIGDAETVVVVEPDAVAQLCGDPASRFQMLRDAVQVLERNPGTHTYLDAGHADWVDAPTMAERLRSAGVTGADGFALNVSNFGTTAANAAYGRQVSALLGGARFVVDTSRNGNGPGSGWCNPAGRAVGERPTTATGLAGVDAFLWVKTPGESDGPCNGGPAAGEFWPAYALGLVRGA